MTPTFLDMARKAGFTVYREESTLGEMLESFAKLIIEHEAAKWYPYGSLDDVTRDLKAEVEASNKMHAELLALKVAARQALEVLDWLLKEDPWAKPDVIGVRNALRRGLEQPTDLPPDFINALKFDVAMRDTANEPVAPVQEPDWGNVGRLIEAAHRANGAGHLTGTSNWAAAVCKYMGTAPVQEPVQTTGETNVQLGFYSDATGTGQQRQLVGEVEMGQLVGDGPHKSAGNPDAEGAVAVIEGIDEHGPMLGWYKHWINFPVGTQFYTTPPAAPVQEPVAFDFQKALKRAYHLGQNYCADADSESYSANKRAEKHRQAFEALCEEALNSQTVTRTAATKIRKYEPTIDLGKYAGTYGGYIKENDND